MKKLLEKKIGRWGFFDIFVVMEVSPRIKKDNPLLSSENKSGTVSVKEKWIMGQMKKRRGEFTSKKPLTCDQKKNSFFNIFMK